MSSVTQRPTTSRRRWRWWVVLGAGLGSAALFVLVWFQPQKLLIDERVDETIPVPTAPPATETGGPGGGSAMPDPGGSAAPVELARGELRSLDHGTSGVARVLELSDGRRVVRLEDLDTSNGPDLFVYLTANPSDGEEGSFDDDYVDLGRLKGNQGNQTYDVPASVDLIRHGTVVIWCDRFDSAFGAADLQPV